MGLLKALADDLGRGWKASRGRLLALVLQNGDLRARFERALVLTGVAVPQSDSAEDRLERFVLLNTLAELAWQCQVAAHSHDENWLYLFSVIE